MVAALVGVVLVPCETSVVTTRGVSVFACISILRIMLELNIMLVLSCLTRSDLILCSVLLVLIALLAFFVCRVRYQVGLSFAGFRFM